MNKQQREGKKKKKKIKYKKRKANKDNVFLNGQVTSGGPQKCIKTPLFFYILQKL